MAKMMNATVVNIPATRIHRFTAIGAIVILTLAVVLVWPFAKSPWLKVEPFLPIFATCVTLTEGITALLLWTQYRISGLISFAALAAAYAFTSVTAFLQLLIFPEVFSPTGLLGAGSQSAVWIWVFWHGGFPSLILITMTLRWMCPNAIHNPRTLQWYGGGLVLGGIAFSIALCALAIDGKEYLPSLVSGTSYAGLLGNPSAVFVELLSLIALAVLVLATRLRTLIDLWLAVALYAAVADITLTLGAGARYTIGWYAARAASMIAASSLLGVLIYEISYLYNDLNAAHKALSESARRDGLTNAYNRGYFEEYLQREFESAITTNQTLTLLLIDVDHFKNYNDSFGHQAGDKCLQKVVQTLDAILQRQNDFLARYGGEEFVVILSSCDIAKGVEIAETLRNAVANMVIPEPSGNPPDKAVRSEVEFSR